MVQMPAFDGLVLEGRDGEHRGRQGGAGIGDHHGAAGARPGQHVRGLLLVEAIRQQERHVIAAAGEADGQVDLRVELLEQRDQRTRPVGLVGPRVEGAVVVGRPVERGAARARRPRWHP